MIPLRLSLSGFLSYREPVEIDFTAFELACISGPNGAGKSSLLDAVTWALFGQARKRDEALINSQSSAAEVTLDFAYEGNIYRVQRALPRGKTTVLEYFIKPGMDKDQEAGWKALTERTLRETQARIEETLRLDYDTFVNASFFLQGKADQFTQQRPGDRKRILGSILGLEIWETYRQRAAERRKGCENEIAVIDSRLADILAELNEEQTRKARLKELEAELGRLSKARTAQEAALDNIRKTAAVLAEQHKMLAALERQLEATQRRSNDLNERLIARQREKASFEQVISNAPAIEAAYKAWQQARADIEYWDEIAGRFREHEKRRQPLLDEINARRARLMQEQTGLLAQQVQVTISQSGLASLQADLDQARSSMVEAEARLARRISLENEMNTARQRQAEARAENPRLKEEMNGIKAHIDQLQEMEAATCPFCGQLLIQADRLALIERLQAEGTEMGDRYRANVTLLQESDDWVKELEEMIQGLGRAEAERLQYAQKTARMSEQFDNLQRAATDWEQKGAARLAEITASLEREDFCPEASLRLEEVDRELKAIGYDAAAHDAARRLEAESRQADTDMRSLERAQAALAPLERELAELTQQAATHQEETKQQQVEYDQAAAALAAAEAQAPDLGAAERELLAAQEQENRLRLEVGAARQKVAVLADQKKRRKSLEAQREEQARLVSQYRQLEQAFGKDGVPALLIEQALPQIEGRANEILDRLSAGGMSVRFVTQAAYKDKRREDLKETLDIQISDGAGTRDYELFSGGEAFRVNFAIRLALSEVLAQRAGARLQTLVIDEGFGSQDTQGRQRLIEAINLVQKDFAKILVITHIDELKDAFPSRLEVEKTPRGSVVKVL